MADVNKSIEISYKADLKQLLANLKQMPGMTEKQAKEMVSGLQKQLKQAEKAAKNTGKTTEREMKRIEHSAERAEEQLDELHGSAGDVGSVLSGIAGAIGLVNPELEGMAMAAADSVGGLEGLVGVGKFLNPAFAAFAVLAAGAAVAVSSYTAEQEKAAQAAEDLAKEQEELNKKLEEFHKIQGASIATLGQFTAELNMAQAEVLMLSGEISKADFESMQRDIEANKIAERLKKTAQDRVDALRGEQGIKERNLQLAKQELRDIIDNRAGSEGLTKEMAKRAEKRKEIAQLEFELEKFIDNRRKLESQINLDYDAQAAKLLDLKKQAKDLQAQHSKTPKTIKKSNDLLKEQEAIFNSINDSLKASQASQESAKTQLLDLIAKQDGKEAEIQRKMTKQTDAINDQIHAAQQRLMTAQLQAETDEQIFAAQELEKATLVEIEVLEVLRHEKRVAMEQELADLKETNAQKDLENIEKIKEAERKAIFDNFNDAAKLNDASIGLADALIQKKLEDFSIEKETFDNMTKAERQAFAKKSKAAEQDIIRLFRFNQAAALANVAFAVAEGLAESAGRPLKMAAVVAAGIASTAKIAAQKPPTADMGMIGNNDPLRPDETTTRVLRGEAVIDRATVNRLGGEQGVRALQEGGNVGGGVVVVQPFKHFDRFIKQASQSGAIFRQTKPVSY
jgi:DNA repair exonuclease SbcCD ATPase subunit